MFNKNKEAALVPKFAYDQRVKIVNGFYREAVGRCVEFSDMHNTYIVKTRLVDGSDAKLFGIPESYLEAI